MCKGTSDVSDSYKDKIYGKSKIFFDLAVLPCFAFFNKTKAERHDDKYHSDNGIDRHGYSEKDKSPDRNTHKCRLLYKCSNGRNTKLNRTRDTDSKKCIEETICKRIKKYTGLKSKIREVSHSVRNSRAYRVEDIIATRCGLTTRIFLIVKFFVDFL